MKKIAYIFLLAAVLGGCKGPEYKYTSYQQKVGDWVGKDANFLYDRWGKPNKVESTGVDSMQVTYYQTDYIPENNVINPSVREFGQEVMAMIYEEPHTPPEKYSCETIFMVRNGVVVDYKFDGDGCR